MSFALRGFHQNRVVNIGFFQFLLLFFEFSFDEGESFVGGDDMAADATWAKELLSDALAQGVGVVEKVDFDQLVFESGDD